MARPVARAPAPLDEVMLAMDVVDTLRHRELLVERELGTEERERRLVERLREIYSSQGIEVSDEVLAQGVAALRDERFVYVPPAPGPGRVLARLYVTRGRWGRWVGGIAAIAGAALLSYQLFVRGPELRAIAALPADLATAYSNVADFAEDPVAVREANELLQAGKAALARSDHDAAREAVADLGELRQALAREYELRVVSRPGELSGVWRVPDINPESLNYYLIVEPVAPDGSRLTVPVRNEEDGRIERVSRFGLRVDEATFQRVARDKRDDGIIQQNVVGVKRRGELDPEYRVATSGAAITEW